MDLVQLRYFVQVVDLRSFTKAAAALHIAQPAITRQMHLLEDELGVQLLYRHSRGAEPTEAGRQLRMGAQAIFRLLEQTRADVIASSAVVSGSLRIGFPPSMGDLLLGDVIGTFRARHPNVELSLQEGYSHAMRDALLGDRLDLAFITGHDTNPLLMTTHLYDEQIWLMEPPAASGKPQRKKRYRLTDVASRDLIQPSRTNTLRQMLDDQAARQKLALKVVVEAEALHLIKDLVRRGVGSHLSPYSAVVRGIERGAFVGGPVDGLSVSRFLVRRVDRPVSLALTRFQEILTARLAEIHQTARGAVVLPGAGDGRRARSRGA
ncbi:LysR family transcriptional regulator [Pigmentiphaga litoralis]|uniref:LysR family transcriptional regulator n=1 Tax=Pigmentiphaga litoralis TaxID=516702 RepID=UPI003B427A3D